MTNATNIKLQVTVSDDNKAQLAHILRPVDGFEIDGNTALIPVGSTDARELVIDQLLIGYASATPDECRLFKRIARAIGVELYDLARR